MYWLVGFNLMYPGDAWTIAGWVGTLFAPTSLEPVGLAAADASLDYASVASDFFFQLMFCATTASIVSGTLAERIKLWPFLIFVVVLTGFIYPIEASWQWGGGWLSEMGFYDFAGSTLVHAAGGFAALAGAIVLGPRLGKYKDGTRRSRCRVRTSRSPRSGRSSCGSAGSASTAVRSLRPAPWATSPTWAGSSPTPTWRRRPARWRR